MTLPSYSRRMVTAGNRWRIIGQAVLGLGITFLFFYTMAPFMITLVIGAVIAILCEPLYRRLRKYLPRPLAGGILTAGVTLLILTPLTFVSISVAYRLAEILSKIKVPRLGDLSNLSEHPAVVRLIHQIPSWVPINREWLQEQSLAIMQRVLEKISELLGAFLGGLPGLLLGFGVVIVATYFLIVDGQRFAKFLGSISPLPPDKSQELFDAFASSCRGVVLAMFASSFVQGTLIAIFFTVTGISHPILWGSIGVILGMVPVIGVAPITLGGILFHFLSGNIVGGVVLLVGAVIIGFSDNVVRPWVLKGHGEMHPLLGLVSAFGAVSVLGPTGIILGPIIAAVFVAFLEILSADLRPKFHAEGAITVP